MVLKIKEHPTWKDVKREVKEAGGVFVRQGATSHEIWRLPNGTRVNLRSKYPNQQVTKSVRDRVRADIEALRSEEVT